MTLFGRMLLYLDVIRRVGFHNAAYVAWYRFSLKFGLRKRFCTIRPFVEAGPYFQSVDAVRDYPDGWKAALIADAERIVQGSLRYYTRHWHAIGNPPNWFLNPFNGRVWANQKKHWIDLQDFSPDLGDVKHVWEASRFEWVVTLARAYAISGSGIYLDSLNQRLSNWAISNPINSGPNWKCGQEAAIRIFNLLQAVHILQQLKKPSTTLYEFVYRHLERISANIRYAIAQDNNHGTSEAAALFLGGLWCLQNASIDTKTIKKCRHFIRIGRRWLENRIEKLVAEDGSFSQHSVTYHRVLLDTLIFVEFFRRQFATPPFSDIFYQRSRAALNWLGAMTDEHSGGAPNLGANDGAMLLNTHSCDCRDFRPSIQAASFLFCGHRRFAEGPWDEPSSWFGLHEDKSQDSLAITDVAKVSQVLPGGYVIMAGSYSWGMLRFPMYRFRPSQNDVFHFDLWWQGMNICRDDGSYSYHPDDVGDADYFGSVKAHNTVCFDDGEQMPRLGRFLMGKWIVADNIGAIENQQDGWQRWCGAYRDWQGHSHQRVITWKDNDWIIEDDFNGNFEKVEIRFRLTPDEYQLGGDGVSSSWGRIAISGTDFQICFEDGFESLYYQEKQLVKVLVIRPANGCKRITSRFILNS